MLNLVHSIPLYDKKMHTQGSSTSSQWHSDSDGNEKIQFKRHLHVKQVSAYHSNWFGSATSAGFEPKTSSTSVINLNTSPREEPRSVTQGVTLWTRQDKRRGRTVESLAIYGWMMLLRYNYVVLGSEVCPSLIRSSWILSLLLMLACTSYRTSYWLTYLWLRV